MLVDNDKVVNAWCMPGGKIAVYTGILKITKNLDALSIVMGHEIAHAVAKHSIERQSQALTLNIGTQVADIFLGGAINRTRSTVGRNTGFDIFQLGIMNPFIENKIRSGLFGINFFFCQAIILSLLICERMAEKK